MIVFAAIMPHPPMSIPGIGTTQDLLKISKTLNAFESLRVGLEAADPDTIIVISPHGHLEPYAFVINSEIDLSGSLSKFGSDVVYEYKNNIELADRLEYTCLMNDFPVHLRPGFLDHGVLIPLYHLTKNIKPKIIHLSFSLMNYEQHFRYGEIIRWVIDNIGTSRELDVGRIAIIASGDLSHKITLESPVGFSPSAKEFDHMLIRFLGSDDLASLMGMEPSAIAEAAECGLRSIVVLL
jgi:aromatic ring-opening dioxygenase LigB subunit